MVAGRYLINPFFRLLARTDAREVMTAAALLVVLGAALLMQSVGMSMALGAFLAGVLLAESTYRHELKPTSSRSAACCSRCSSWALA